MDHWAVERGDHRPRPCPVKVGEEYEVVIETEGSLGDGLARIKGFIVFVPSAKYGDHVKVRITRIGRASATAEIIEKRGHSRRRTVR
jgi:predicted RNA-binding protein with TRAM domain